ncbi:MAG: hypothetical protein V1495_06585 [Pseudomonadota bacterium]
MRERLSVLFFLFVTALVVSYPLSPDFLGPGADREVYRYIGMVVRHGGMPYLDAFDNKPPVMFLITALVHEFGPWGIWLAESLAIAGGAFFLFRIAEEQKTPIVGMFLALWLILLVRTPLVAEGGGLTRGFCPLLYLGGAWVLRGSSRWRFAIAGVVVGLLIELQPEEILPFVPFVGIAWMESPDRRRNLMKIGVGVLAVVAPITIWLAVRSALGSFWETFAFDRVWVGAARGDLASRWWLLVTRLWDLELLFPSLFALLLAGIALARSARHRWLIGAVLTVVLQLVAIRVLRRGYGHYFQPLVPLVLLLVLFSLESLVNRWRTFALSLFLLSAALPAGRSLSDAWDTLLSPKGVYASVVRDPWRQILEPYRGQRGSLYVMRRQGALALYTDFDIIAPTRWIYTLGWERRPPGREMREILDGIERFRTRYIYDFTTVRPFSSALQEVWEAHLKAHYRVRSLLPEGARLWERLPSEKLRGETAADLNRG